MIGEEMLLSRAQVEAVVAAMQAALSVEAHYQFKLRFGEQQNVPTLRIVPHATPIDVDLDPQKRGGS